MTTNFSSFKVQKSREEWKMAYMSGINFYTTYEEAVKRYYELANPSLILEKHKGGSGSIVWLQDKPSYVGQAEYVGNN